MPISSGELARKLQLELRGAADVQLTHVAPINRAGKHSLTFANHPRYLPQLSSCKAAAVILKPEWATGYAGVCIVSDNPYLSYAKAAGLLHPRRSAPEGIHPSAEVEEGVVIEGGVSIGANTTIASGVRLGKHVVIGAGCHIGNDASIAEETQLAANVVLEHNCQLGKRCLVQAGAIIGSDGFGYALDADGWVHIPQIGRVVIGDRVEIGANTTIDRGAMDDTVIEDGVILDNQIQVAHNVVIGESTAIAGCVGIAGSARIGKRCTIGGATTVLGHLEIVDDVHVNAMSLVASSITEPGRYASNMPVDDDVKWRKNYARFRRLDEMARRLRDVEKTLSALKMCADDKK